MFGKKKKRREKCVYALGFFGVRKSPWPSFRAKKPLTQLWCFKKSLTPPLMDTGYCISIIPLLLFCCGARCCYISAVLMGRI